VKTTTPPALRIIGAKGAFSFSEVDAVAISAELTEVGPRLLESEIASAVATQFALDLRATLSQWPEFTGKAGELVEIPLHHDRCKRLFIIGVGSHSSSDLRKAGVTLGRKVKGKSLTVLHALLTSLISPECVILHLNALALSQYVWSKKSEKKPTPCTFILYGNFEKQMRYSQTLIEAVWLARDLIHETSDEKNPAWMATATKAAVKKMNSPALSVEVLSGAALKNFGGLQAVGGSQPNPGPRLIQVRYSPPASAHWPHVVLVGKGITYDTGGYSLKRGWEVMAPMKTDMSGAAVVMATTLAMAQVQPKVRVTALMMCAANLVSGTAQRPSDVITQYGGTTVEVLDTDAEGRLVLADGLAYADLELEPDYLIDVATLTSAARVGLGRQYAAMYSRDSALAARIHEVGKRIGDNAWPMPLVDDYAQALHSNVADFANIDRKKFGAGSIIASLFLEKFVGKRRWVHLDIAGSGRSDSDSGENVKGGTASGVRLLIDWIASL
jgi:leucyl aminopeptidase